MTRYELIGRMGEIALAAIADDDERAHILEDRLREDVLAAIGDGDPDHQWLATEVLKTREIQFSRWCA